MMTAGFSPYSTSQYLDSDDAIVAYLHVVLEDGDPEAIVIALKNIAEARGVAEPTINRSDIGSVNRAMRSLGFELTAKAA